MTGHFLQIMGIGYKANVSQDGKHLQLKFGKIIKSIIVDPGVRIFTFGNSGILFCVGIEKNSVMQFAAKIKAIKPPERYKRKGIYYKKL